MESLNQQNSRASSDNEKEEQEYIAYHPLLLKKANKMRQEHPMSKPFSNTEVLAVLKVLTSDPNRACEVEQPKRLGLFSEPKSSEGQDPYCSSLPYSVIGLIGYDTMKQHYNTHDNNKNNEKWTKYKHFRSILQSNPESYAVKQQFIALQKELDAAYIAYQKDAFNKGNKELLEAIKTIVDSKSSGTVMATSYYEQGSDGHAYIFHFDAQKNKLYIISSLDFEEPFLDSSIYKQLNDPEFMKQQGLAGVGLELLTTCRQQHTIGCIFSAYHMQLLLNAGLTPHELPPVMDKELELNLMDICYLALRMGDEQAAAFEIYDIADIYDEPRILKRGVIMDSLESAANKIDSGLLAQYQDAIAQWNQAVKAVSQQIIDRKYAQQKDTFILQMPQQMLSSQKEQIMSEVMATAQSNMVARRQLDAYKVCLTQALSKIEGQALRCRGQEERVSHLVSTERRMMPVSEKKKHSHKDSYNLLASADNKTKQNIAQTLSENQKNNFNFSGEMMQISKQIPLKGKILIIESLQMLMQSSATQSNQCREISVTQAAFNLFGVLMQIAKQMPSDKKMRIIEVFQTLMQQQGMQLNKCREIDAKQVALITLGVLIQKFQQMPRDKQISLIEFLQNLVGQEITQLNEYRGIGATQGALMPAKKKLLVSPGKESSEKPNSSVPQGKKVRRSPIALMEVKETAQEGDMSRVIDFFLHNSHIGAQNICRTKFLQQFTMYLDVGLNLQESQQQRGGGFRNADNGSTPRGGL